MSFDASLLHIRAAVRILKGEFQMKQYQKPEVNYENFALAEHIAQCSYQLNSARVEDCAIVTDRVPGYGDWEGAFTKSTHSCTIVGEDYCYTNGGGLLSLFQS